VLHNTLDFDLAVIFNNNYITMCNHICGHTVIYTCVHKINKRKVFIYLYIFAYLHIEVK